MYVQRAEVVVLRSRRTLVVLQVALAVTVVIVAGLLTRSLLRLQMKRSLMGNGPSDSSNLGVLRRGRSDGFDDQ